MRAARAGSALIVVLWVVGLLAVLIGSMAFDAHIEARITSYYRKRAKAEALARSGIEVARMLLIKRGEITSDDQEGDKNDRWFDAARRLKRSALRGLVENLGDGTITLDIVPEPARRNINNLDLQNNVSEVEVEDNLERILETGGITEDTGLWPPLIESFLDWVDADDKARAAGAETDDYYATLKPPYKAANRALETVEELLLVKGFNRAILSGGTLDTGVDREAPRPVSGIADLLTTYGDGKVNVNSASQRVLMTLPGVDDVVAGAIIEEREGLKVAKDKNRDQPFQNEGDLFKRIPGLDANRLSRYITTADSAICRITSIGDFRGVRHRVWCIGEFSAGKITILRWREED